MDRCPIVWIRGRLECCPQLARRQRKRIEREARSPQAQRGQRGRRQPDAQRVQLRGATAQHRVDRAVGDEPALLVEHDGTIDETDRRVEIVLHEQDRAIAVRDQLGKCRIDLFDALGIEVRGRLVQHEERRTHRERARDRESLPSAARQAVGVLGAAVPQPHAAQRGLGAVEHVGHRHPQVLGSERDLVEQGPRHQLCVGVLEDHAHMGAELGDRGRGDIVAGDFDRPPHVGRHRLRDQAVHREGQRRLARSARPEQQHDLARLDVEARRCGGRRILVRVGDRQIAHPQQRDAAGPRAARGSHARQGCLCRGGRVALECGHGSSQERN